MLYAAKELGDSDPFIWVADITGNLPTQISRGSDPSWIDDDTITFVSTDENTELDTIWTQKTNGAQLTQIVSDPEAHCLHPSPSSDGRYIAYAKQDSSEMIAEKSRQQRKRIDPPETRDIYVYDRRTGLSQQ